MRRDLNRLMFPMIGEQRSESLDVPKDWRAAQWITWCFQWLESSAGNHHTISHNCFRSVILFYQTLIFSKQWRTPFSTSHTLLPNTLHYQTPLSTILPFTHLLLQQLLLLRPVYTPYTPLYHFNLYWAIITRHYSVICNNFYHTQLCVKQPFLSHTALYCGTISFTHSSVLWNHLFHTQLCIMEPFLSYTALY